MSGVLVLEFVIVGFQGRPVVACSKSLTFFDVVRAGGLLPRNSIKRRLFVYALPLLYLLNRFKPSAYVISDGVDGLLRDAMSALGTTAASKFVLVWPGEVERKRLYVHALNESMQPVAFGKISTEVEGHDREKMSQEKEVLLRLGGGNPRVVVPEVLGWAETHDGCYLLTTNCVAGTDSFQGEWELLSELMCGLVGDEVVCRAREELDGEHWWRVARKAYPNVANEVIVLVERKAGWFSRVCHGDLGPANVLRRSQQVVVLDWEECCECAPVLGDEVVYWLSLRHSAIISDPVRVLDELLSAFPDSYLDLLLSLMYLSRSGAGKSRVILGVLESRLD